MVQKQIEKTLHVILPDILRQHSIDPVDTEALRVPELIEHEGTECKGCQQRPIVGPLYICLECTAFYLCAACEENQNHPHALIKYRSCEQKRYKITKHPDSEAMHVETDEPMLSLPETRRTREVSCSSSTEWMIPGSIRNEVLSPSLEGCCKGGFPGA